MTRFIITTAVLTCGLISGISQDVSAQCHNGSGHPVYGYAPGYGYQYGYADCHTDYQQDPHYRYFVLLKRRPDLAAQHADLAAQLNIKFGRFLNASEMITVNGQIAGGSSVITKEAGTAALASSTVSEAVPAAAATPAAAVTAGPAAPAATAVTAAPAAPAVTAAPAAPAVGEAVAAPAGPSAAPAAPAVDAPAAAAPAADAAPAAPPVAAPPVAAPPAANDTTAPEHPSDLPTPLAAAQAAAATTPATPGVASATVSDELKPILGLWRNVVKSSDGSEQVTEVELIENGTAKVTVDAGLLGKRTINGQFAVEDGNFNLKEGDNSVTLGKVVSADKDQVVLKRGDLTLNFTRP